MPGVLFHPLQKCLMAWCGGEVQRRGELGDRGTWGYDVDAGWSSRGTENLVCWVNR